MIVQCAGIFNKNPDSISVGVVIITSSGNKYTKQEFVTPTKNWDSNHGGKAAEAEAVIVGLVEAYQIFSKWKAHPTLTRMSFVDLGNGAPNPLDFRGLKEIKVCTVDRTAQILNNNNTTIAPYLKDYFRRYQGLKISFHDEGIELIPVHVAVPEARRIAVNAEPLIKLAKYKKSVKTLLERGDYVIPLSVFKRKNMIS